MSRHPPFVLWLTRVDLDKAQELNLDLSGYRTRKEDYLLIVEFSSEAERDQVYLPIYRATWGTEPRSN